MLELLKNVPEHAKIYWKHALECPKIVFEKVEKSWKKLKKVEKMFLESPRIWCSQIMAWKKHLSSQIRPRKTKVWPTNVWPKSYQNTQNTQPQKAMLKGSRARMLAIKNLTLQTIVLLAKGWRATGKTAAVSVHCLLQKEFLMRCWWLTESEILLKAWLLDFSLLSFYFKDISTLVSLEMKATWNQIGK